MRTYNARAWLVWLLAGGLLVLVTRNPIYLLLLLATSRLVHAACAAPVGDIPQLPFGRVSVMILLFSTCFNALTAHVGDTVLLSLPGHWWLIGGPITLEAAAYGFITGLSLVTLLSLFLAFNAIVPTGELVRLVPVALYELGLVVLLAITYVPETARQLQRIREAQAIRGHRLRGLRDWQPIVIPLLIGGLERSLSLAETMVARGLGSADHLAPPWRVRLLMLLGLALALLGALQLALAGSEGWLFILLGMVAVGMAYRVLSRGVELTRYRPRPWTAADTAIVLAALLPLVLLLPLPVMAAAGLEFTPYPRMNLPPFALWAGTLLLGLAVPAVLQVVAPQGREPI